VGSYPATIRRERLRKIGERLRERSRQWVCGVRRATHVGEVVIGESAATTYAREPSERVMLRGPGTVEALHAEITRLRNENDDLRASARLWADLYEQAVKRPNALERRAADRVEDHRNETVD
jgi:hypothetical protein